MDATHYAAVLRVLAARETAKGWAGRCPCSANHRNGDRSSSLSLTLGDDGRLVVCCHRGCSFGEIVAASGTLPADWFPPKPGPKRTRKSMKKPDHVYQYVDWNGRPVYQVVRWDQTTDPPRPKRFAQRRPGPDGQGWVWGLKAGFYAPEPFAAESVTPNDWFAARAEDKGAKQFPEQAHVLYNLSAIKAAHIDNPLVVVEGEAKVDALRELGLLATTSTGGAGKWNPEWGRYLFRRRVYVWPDNDDVGRLHGYMVAACGLEQLAASVAVVARYEDPVGADVVDFLRPLQGKTKDERRDAVVKVLKAAVEWKPAIAGRAAA